ncbi:MAG: AAA family ATPase [Candidatus Magnetomorum sp.]|nr:AAA family ATPase [Candidatus Magnetomorum sp.]
MKILSVTLKNINALRGRWQIDFNLPPLEKAGIFVICGPTGSGKTSLLDAITLALYGETDRLPKRDIENIMTRHTGDCYCEVVFQVNQNTYKSHWSIRRAKGQPDAKVQAPKRLLYEMNGDTPVVIAEKIKSVQDKIETITGLDFKRFSRSMMLAQGRFAEFLNAPDRERAELLEKITGTDIYSKLSIKAFERTRQEKETLRDLQTVKQAIPTLSPEDIETLQKEKIAITEQAAQKKLVIQSLQKQKEHLKRIERLTNEKKRYEQTLAHIRQQESDMQPELLRLKRSRQAREFQSELDAVTSQKKRLDELAADIQSINDQLENNGKHLQDIEKKITISQKQFDDAQKKQIDAEPLIQQALVIDRDLEKLQQQINSIQKDLKSLSSRHSHLEKIKKDAERKQDNVRNQQQQNSEWLDKHAHNKNLSEHIPYIQADLEAIQETRRHYQTRQKKINQYKKDLNTILDQTKKKQSLRTENQKELDRVLQKIHTTEGRLRKNLGDQTIDALETQLNESRHHYHTVENLRKISAQFVALKTDIKASREQLKKTVLSKFHTQKTLQHVIQNIIKEDETLKALAQAVQHEMLVAKYSENRRLLDSGKPCPLCGSEHHPYVQSKKVSSETQIQKEYEKKKKQMDALLQKREYQKTESAKYEGKISTQMDTLVNKTNHQRQLCQEWDHTAHTIQSSLDIQHYENVDRLLKEIKTRTDTDQKRYHQSKQMLEQSHALRKTLQEKKDSDFTLQDEVKTLDFQIQKMNHDIQELSSACDDIQAQGKKLAQQAASKLSHYQLAVPEFGKEETFIDLLNQKAHEFQKQLLTGKQLETESQHLRQQVTEYTFELKTLSQQLTTLTDQENQRLANQIQMKKERYQLLGDKKPDQEKKGLLATLEKYEILLQKHRAEFLKLEKKSISHETLKKNKQDEASSLQLAYDQGTLSLMNHIQPKGFQSIVQLQEAIIPLSESRNIQNRFDLVQQTIHQEQTRFHDISEQLTLETKTVLSEASLESLEAQLRQQDLEFENLARRTGSIEQVLLEENKRNDAREKALQQLHEQELQYKRWNDLNQLIGSADGNTFRTFAQGLTLNRLIEYSNRHLKNFSDRYVLQRLSPQSLTLNIMDTYQANALRPTGTLSGGESFLVSLSMAIGLSDLAGNTIRVESLFLDEGFGALDEETLEVALSAIERLNHSGKMIGVISHLDSLKERIPIHIEVSKVVGGNSRLDIVGS